MPKFILKDRDNPRFQDLDDFTQGYIEALFFTEHAPGEYAEDWNPEEESAYEGTIPADVGFLDLDESALAKILADCTAFYGDAKIHNLLKKACTDRRRYDYDMNQAGIDFWFTRNGHGAGFWDRGLGQIGDDLSDSCGWKTSFPEVYVFFRDGKVHIE